MERIEPRTLSGFMELLPNEQILFNQMKEKIQKTEGIVSKDSTKTILNHASTSSRHVLSKSIKNSPKQEVTLQDSVTGTGEKDSIKSSNHQIIEKQDIKDTYNSDF